MKVIIITQDDPFYLGRSIRYLLNRMPVYVEVPACVVFKVSPYGKRENFLKKAWKALDLFGPWFFINYGFRFLISKVNRKNSLSTILKEKNIPEIRLKSNINHSESLQIISAYRPDLLISIAGNQIFKKRLIELAPKGCLNLHTALLPKYRGLMPTFWVLKNDEKETGVSVFFVDEGIDSGPIVVQKRVPILPAETQRDLIIKTKKIGMDALLEAIELIHRDKVVLISNDEHEKTYFSFPTKKDVLEFRSRGKKFF